MGFFFPTNDSIFLGKFQEAFKGSLHSQQNLVECLKISYIWCQNLTANQFLVAFCAPSFAATWVNYILCIVFKDIMPLFYFRFNFSIIILSFCNINNSKKSFCIELSVGSQKLCLIIQWVDFYDSWKSMQSVWPEKRHEALPEDLSYSSVAMMDAVSKNSFPGYTF